MKKLVVLMMMFFSVSACANTSVEKRSKDRFERDIKVPAAVKVLRTSKGALMVDNDAVVVDDSQRIVWVGPEGMVVRFPKGSPFKAEKLKSRAGVINVQAERIDWKKGELLREYKYEVIIGDIVLDPIIIRRRHF
ncbi:MAG: hypothetical protein K6L76_13370 [Agarilytica sp.]